MEKSVAPSAPMPELDNNAVQTHMPPPTYDQAMSTYPPLITNTVQSGQPPVLPPYPPTQMPYPPAPQPQMPYPPAPQSQQYIPGQNVHPSPQPNLSLQPMIPPQEPPTTTVILSAPVAVGPKPCRLRCPYCQTDIKTSTETQNQSAAHIACVIMCLLGCCLCSCIPYCMDSCKIVQHKCPLCKSFLGTYKA